MPEICAGTGRVAFYLFIPVAFIVLLPLVLLIAAGFYLLAFLQGMKAVLTLLSRKQDPVHPLLQKPHFLDAPLAIKLRTTEETEQST